MPDIVIEHTFVYHPAMFTWRNSTIASSTWDIGDDPAGVTTAKISRNPDGTWRASMIGDAEDLPGGPWSREEAQQAAEAEWRRRSEAKHRTRFGAG